MVKTLELAGILGKTAFVMQARMFQEMDELIAQGILVTDAREQTEKNHLILETQF